MAGCSQPPRSDQPSIKYRCNPLEGAFFELADFVQEDYAPTPSDSNKQSNRKSEPKSSERLSTAELISSVGQIWDCASRSLAILQPKTNLKHNDGEFQKGDILCYPSGQENGRASASGEGQYLSVDWMTSSHSSPMAIANLECPKVTQKMSIFETCGRNHMHSLFWRFLEGGSDMANESWKEKGLASVGISYDLGNIYGWMRETTVPGLKHLVNSTQIRNVKTGESCILGDESSHASRVSGNITSPAHDLIVESANSHNERTKCIDSSSGDNANSLINTSSSISSLYSDYFLGPVQVTEASDSVSSTLRSRLHADYDVTLLASGSCAFGDSQHKTEDGDLHENKRSRQKEFVVEDEPKLEICPSTQDKPHVVLAKQEHAFAGALAGVFVSLCLHPVDTIKTVIQSCRADQKSIHYIGRSIISERGVTGLYRGISSNIACSAPISAVYTFTYESVKGALLPLFPKEYHSFAHCMAGGCASIATSFIFTPSERIKQQMQVRSHYHNCWNALVGIIEKGGLPSLYAGWGAVLCRNVPHSIIKFYTYESLKQFMLSSLQPNAQPNTLQTLICGGLAGSTAALFTTPFDVVKTRLQTQIPGSVKQYDGVFKILKEIGKREGLRGLYRGLSPRLVMYMSQGALFFASYETFKRLFSLDVPQLNAQTIQHEQNMEDDSKSSPLLASPSPSPPPRLHSLHS
uniref:Mitochondrial substrate carrier family protein n=1 Tax=Davidia involucrata TaxID=16924 RepID=A0A5B7CCE9_DAVIN